MQIIIWVFLRVNNKLGIMIKYGLGIGMSCNDALTYMKVAAEHMVWYKYFSKAYELYSIKQVKVAGFMYLVLGYIGVSAGMINAANIFDAHKVLSENELWFNRENDYKSLNKEISYLYYKEALKQGLNMGELQLGFNYLYGYADPIDNELALNYFEKSLTSGLTETFKGFANFQNANMHHFGQIVTQNFTKAREFYSESLAKDKFLYYPVKIMELLMDYQENKLSLEFDKKSVGMFLVTFIWIIAIIFFIIKRN